MADAPKNNGKRSTWGTAKKKSGQHSYPLNFSIKTGLTPQPSHPYRKAKMEKCRSPSVPARSRAKTAGFPYMMNPGHCKNTLTISNQVPR